MRECEYCGKLFSEKNGHEIFCSEECRHKQKLIKQRIKRKEKHEARNFKPRRSHLKWTDQDVQNRINTKSSKMIYIGGYTDSESPMYIYCDDCGQPFKWNARGLRRQRPIQCDNCRKLLTTLNAIEQKRERIKASLKREQERREIQRQRAEEKILSKHRQCKRCGEEFVAAHKEIYCSTICRQRQSYSTKEHKRRERINNNYSDIISLDILYKRDKGICWLCGKQCDKTDYKVTESGCYIAGNEHPSIDHVQPLAKGGTHTWNNVRLAHMICNTRKRDALLRESANGQMILFL